MVKGFFILRSVNVQISGISGLNQAQSSWPLRVPEYASKNLNVSPRRENVIEPSDLTVTGILWCASKYRQLASSLTGGSFRFQNDSKAFNGEIPARRLPAWASEL